MKKTNIGTTVPLLNLDAFQHLNLRSIQNIKHCIHNAPYPRFCKDMFF